MNLKRALSVILTALLLAGCQPPPSEPSPTPSQSALAGPTPSADRGEASPKFSLTAPDGSTVNFDPSENPDNEIFLVVFWSHRWDPNVKEFLARTSELHERYAPRGLNIIAVSFQEEPDGLRKFLATNSVPFELAVGTEATYKRFELTSIPTSILVDANGRIVERWSGYYTTEELADTITPYLPGRNGNSEE